MMSVFKNRIVLASVLFVLLNFLQGFVIASPLLIFLRIMFENSGSARELWPLPSLEVVSDFLINYPEIIGFYAITAVILYLVFFMLKSFFTAGIYKLIIFRRGETGSINSLKDFIKRSAEIWTGFLKAGLFGFFIFGFSLVLGMIFGDLLGMLGTFFKAAIIAAFLLLGSTYIQIIKIYMAATSDTSLKNAIKNTKEKISSSLIRIVIGNISVVLAALVIFFILWFMLRFIKSNDWSLIYLALAIIVQQLMIFVICFCQSLRINFNYSFLRKGE